MAEQDSGRAGGGLDNGLGSSGIAAVRPWWRKKRWMALWLAIAWYGASTALPRFPIGPFTQYGDLTEAERAARIPYVTLSSEATHPFRASAYRHAGYDRAASRFPDARSCLVRSERAKPDPDIRLIDWYAIGGAGLPWDDAADTAEVCLYRLFAGMRPEAVAEWLSFQGFRIQNLNLGVRHEYGDKIAIDGTRKSRGVCPKLSRGLLSCIFYQIHHTESIHPRWNSELSFYSVQYGFSSL